MGSEGMGCDRIGWDGTRVPPSHAGVSEEQADDRCVPRGTSGCRHAWRTAVRALGFPNLTVLFALNDQISTEFKLNKYQIYF